MQTEKTVVPPIWDDEVIDEKTGHKIVAKGKELVELKFCEECKRWQPIDHFRRSKNYPDGLIPYCKYCTPAADAPRKNYSAAQAVSPEDDARARNIASIEAGLKSLLGEISMLRDRIKEMEKDKMDLNHLPESTVEQILKANRVTPRVLFNAIKKHYPQYSFYCRDEESGLISVIKTEVA